MGPWEAVVCGELCTSSILLQVLIWVQCCFLGTDTARPKKCFSNVKGYCRKKCEMGEAYEIACLKGKLCCVKEENSKYLGAQELPPSPIQSDGNGLYYFIHHHTSHSPTINQVLAPLVPTLCTSKAPSNPTGWGRDLSTSFCKFDSPHNKVLCFSLD